MTYKTIVIDHASKAKKLATEIEHKANEMAETGWEFVTFSTAASGKAILVFRTQNELPDKSKEKEEEKAEKAKDSAKSKAAGEKE